MDSRTAQRIASLKAELQPISEWLDKHRSQRRELLNYAKNYEKAHELRKELCKLRDPKLYARVYR